MNLGLTRLALCGAIVSALSLPALAADQVTLTFWHNHPEWKARVQKILDKFQAENPGIQIQLEEIPGPDYPAKMNTALAAGEAPDIIEAPARPGRAGGRGSRLHRRPERQGRHRQRLAIRRRRIADRRQDLGGADARRIHGRALLQQGYLCGQQPHPAEVG